MEGSRREVQSNSVLYKLQESIFDPKKRNEDPMYQTLILCLQLPLTSSWCIFNMWVYLRSSLKITGFRKDRNSSTNLKIYSTIAKLREKAHMNAWTKRKYTAGFPPISAIRKSATWRKRKGRLSRFNCKKKPQELYIVDTWGTTTQPFLFCVNFQIWV